MDTINNRIFILRKKLNLTQKEFGNKIGLTSSISDIENGKAPITDRTLITICSVFNVNEKWLKTGNGEIFDNNLFRFQEFFRIYNTLNDSLKDFLFETALSLLKHQK